MSAGLDGIHIHGGNGYLISQFSSPITNTRKDGWGGNKKNRDQFFLGNYKAIRKEIGPDRFISARVGIRDVQSNGLSVEEGIARVKKLESCGLNSIEPTYNLMNTYKDNIKPFAGNDNKVTHKWNILFDVLRLEHTKRVIILNYVKDYHCLKLPYLKYL